MKTSNSLKMRKILILILGICFVVPITLAGNDYTISRYVISSGAGVSSGGSGRYILEGTIGQPVTAKSSGSVYSLISGYWHEDTDLIFKNSF